MATDTENVPRSKGFRLFKKVTSAPVEQDVAAEQPKVRRREWATATMLLIFALMGIGLGRAGALWPSFDVFAHFRWQLILFVISLSLALPVFRRKAATAGMALGVVFCAIYGFWPRIEGATVPSKPAGTIRLLQFNFYKNNSDPEAAARALGTYDADIISLVEYTQADTKPLASLFGTYRYMTACPPGCGTILMSKFPLVDKGTAATTGAPNYASATISTPLGKANVFNVQLGRFPNGVEQFQHVRVLARVLGGDGSVILMGDLNAVPGSRVMNEMAESGLSILTGKPTYPTYVGNPQLAIDHILVGSAWEAAGVSKLGAPAGSDHYPIYVDVKAAKNQAP